MAEPAADLSLDTPALLASEEHEVAIVGRSPWYLAWRRLRRNDRWYGGRGPYLPSPVRSCLQSRWFRFFLGDLVPRLQRLPQDVFGRALDLDDGQIRRALRGLSARGVISYRNAYQGRGIKLLEDPPAATLRIDTKELAARAAAERAQTWTSIAAPVPGPAFPAPGPGPAGPVRSPAR